MRVKPRPGRGAARGRGRDEGREIKRAVRRTAGRWGGSRGERADGCAGRHAWQTPESGEAIRVGTSVRRRTGRVKQETTYSDADVVSRPTAVKSRPDANAAISRKSRFFD